MDFKLPGPGGVPFVNFLRSLRPKRPLAALYLVTPEVVAGALAKSVLGLDDFAVKPLYGPDVLERTRVLLRRMSQIPDVIRELSRYASGATASVGGDRRTVTVMFTDVRSFTSLSETRDPETVLSALNEIFAQLAETVRTLGGRIDQFIGDGMMALFGTRGEPGSEAAAVRAACKIIEDAGASELPLLFAGTDMRLGIGLNTGPVVLGPIGPPFARAVTAIGDTVNTAARLCGVAKPGEVIISEPTYEAVKNLVRTLDTREVALKGKREPQRVYSVTLD